MALSHKYCNPNVTSCTVKLDHPLSTRYVVAVRHTITLSMTSQYLEFIFPV